MNSARTNKAGWLRLAAWALCAVPMLVAAERTTPAPSPDPKPGESGIFDRPRGQMHAARPERITEEEWKEARSFLKEHSPARFAQMKTEPKEGVKRFLFNRYRAISKLKTESPQLYQTRIREVELDDQVFDLCLKLKHAHANKPQLEADLNRRIGELFALGLTEREQRIDLVEKSIAVQKKSLDHDKSHQTQLIDEEYKLVLAHGVNGARLDKEGITPTSSSTAPSSEESESN